jgi:hypothetical protein
MLGLELGGESRDAATHDVDDVGRRNLALVELASERVESAIGSADSPLVIDHGVAQHAIEPGADRLLLADLSGPLHTAYERLLYDVLGEGATADAPFDEREEGAMIRDQLRSDTFVE